MNFIKEIIWAIKSGTYSGRANKYFRIGDYQKALHYYQKALRYSSDNSGSGVIFQECISRSYAGLGEYETALSEAEKCLECLNGIDSLAQPLKDAKDRIEYLIKALRNNDSNTINEIIAI